MDGCVSVEQAVSVDQCACPWSRGGDGLIKKQTNANQRQCTPQSGISASVFSMPNLVKPQDTHCV